MFETLKVENVLNYYVIAEPKAKVIKSIETTIIDNLKEGDGVKCRWLACFNPHSYYISSHDNKFSEALRSADWLIPDGAGILIASKILGKNIKSRVTGSDIFFGLLEQLNKKQNLSVFFLGSTKENLKKIQLAMSLDYPNIKVAGVYSPPFKKTYSNFELERMIKAINQANADVLWVGMTAPKQEKWIFENLDKLNVKFAAGVGAVFDFYTGEVKRSPVIFQRLCLEWLPRLIQQPLRLWKRMFISAPYFLWHVFLEKIKLS